MTNRVARMDLSPSPLGALEYSASSYDSIQLALTTRRVFSAEHVALNWQCSQLPLAFVSFGDVRSDSDSMDSTDTAAETTDESDLQPGVRITGLLGKNSGQGGVLISLQPDQVKQKTP